MTSRFLSNGWIYSSSRSSRRLSPEREAAAAASAPAARATPTMPVRAAACNGRRRMQGHLWMDWKWLVLWSCGCQSGARHSDTLMRDTGRAQDIVSRPVLRSLAVMCTPTLGYCELSLAERYWAASTPARTWTRFRNWQFYNLQL